MPWPRKLIKEACYSLQFQNDESMVVGKPGCRGRSWLLTQASRKPGRRNAPSLPCAALPPARLYPPKGSAASPRQWHQLGSRCPNAGAYGDRGQFFFTVPELIFLITFMFVFCRWWNKRKSNSIWERHAVQARLMQLVLSAIFWWQSLPSSQWPSPL